MKILKDLDALLITNPTNIRYLTGFVGAAPNEREAYCLLAQESVYLFTNALYRQQAKKTNATVVEISREEPFAKKLTELLKRSHPAWQGETLKEIRLGFEETDLTVAEYHKIMHVHKNVMLVPTQGLIEKLRMIKRADEVENIRAAAKLTDQCFDFILEKIKPGVTEGIIAWEIESFIKTHGSQLAFCPIVAFNSNTSQPHYIPQPQGPALSVENPNIVLLDFGAKVNGYCSDMTRMIFIGKPKKEWVTAYETVLAAQQKALEYLTGYLTGSRPVTRSGTTADRLVRKIIEKANFPTYPHSLGHGVGLDIHETPRLTINPSTLRQLADRSGLQPGMVITVEPAIYMEGSYGVRLEDLVLLKEDGIEILSTSKKEMIIL